MRDRAAEACRIVLALRDRGHSLWVEEGRLKVTPRDVPDDLLAQLKERRNDVIRVLQARHWQTEFPDSLDELRRFAPAIWRMARSEEGWEGLVYGVNARGVQVTRDPHGTILTVDPKSLQFEPPD